MSTLVNLEQSSKHLYPSEVTDEGIMMLANLEQPEKHELPKAVTDEGMIILVKLEQSLNAFSPNFVTGYSAPSLAFTFSGTTISPEYLSPLLATTVAVFASESMR